MEKAKFFCPVREISRTETFVVSGVLESTNDEFYNIDYKINVSDWKRDIIPQDIADAIINEIGCPKDSISVDSECIIFDSNAFDLKQRSSNTVLVTYNEYKTVVGIKETTVEPRTSHRRRNNR